MCGMRSNKREKDVMFDEKRRDVWCKTTCRFVENNVSFCWKQRVICWSMSERKKRWWESARRSPIQEDEERESVTLVTAKNQHRCWKARARTYVRRVSGEHLRIFGDEANEKLSLGLFSLRTCFFCILLTSESKIEVSKKNSAVFRGFFTLFPCFNPYSIRGLCNRGKSWRLIACDCA